MNGITLRKATLNDTDEMTAVWLDAMRLHEKWDSRCRLMDDAATSFKSFLVKSLQNEKEDALWLVSESKGVMAGVGGSLHPKHQSSFLSRQKGVDIVCRVKPEFMRNGIGTLILEEYKKWFRSRGISYVEITVAEANATGVRFWENNGFSGLTRKMSLHL